MKINRAIPKESLRLLVWDLDGTLVDSMKDLAAAVNATRRSLRLEPLPLDIIRSYVGRGARSLIKQAVTPAGGPEPKKMALEHALGFFLDHYGRHLLDATRPYPGIPEILKGSRLPMAVLTNKPLEHSMRILKVMGLSQYFQRIYGGDSFERRKPDPSGALVLLDELNVEPWEALMIGDSDNDTLTARQSGMWSLGVNYGYGPDSLADPAPDMLVDSVEELAAFISQIGSGGAN